MDLPAPSRAASGKSAATCVSNGRTGQRWRGAHSLGAAPTKGAQDDGFQFTLDRNWRITSISKSAAAWAGSTVEDLVGRDGRDINPAATRALAEPIDAAIAQAKVSTLELQSTHVPGRWVKVDVEPFQEGARIRFEDITSEEPLAMLDHGAAEIVLLDRRGVIVAANAAWRAGVVALGLKLTNAGVGARYAAVAKVIVPATDEIVFASRLEELFCGGVSEFEATFTQETPAGKSRRQVRISPLRIGHAGYFLAIHEDLSQRVKVLAALHETSEQLLHAQENERQRIAIELHDSMGQHLAGLMLGLTQLRRKIGQDPAAAQADVGEMVKLTQQAAQEMRVLSYLMNAAGGKREGLEASVRRLVEGFARRTGLRASLATRGPVDAIDAVTEHAMFRVTQEALTNVYRHARAKKVSVRLDSRPGTLTVRISDDGHGVHLATGSDLGEAPLGVGIMGMRVRVEQLGGMLEIAGGAGGTVVTAMVPFSPAASAAAGPP